MKALLKKLPLPISGLMLALAATGNLVLSYGNIYKNIFGYISATILILLILKVITEPQSVSEGLNNPVICSVMPTFSMGIMILSTYIKLHFGGLAYGTWIVGLLLHCVMIIYFTWKYVVNFDIKKVFPSYFIVYVGIVAASVTAPTFGLAALGQYIFWFGITAYLALLPIVLYRVIIVKGIPEPALPTIIIFAAPASLCLAGYMNSFQQKSMTMITFLACLALLMTICALLCMPKMLKLKFYPSFSSFTFPFVISGIALKLTNGFLIKSNRAIDFLKYIVNFEELIAILVVLYVLLKYISFLLTNVRKVKSSNTIKL
jgi:exfoliative toxin A/B